MRYLAGFFGLILFAVLFFAGFQLGLFLFSNKEQVNVDLNESGETRIVSNIVSPNQPTSTPPISFCAEEINFLNEDDARFCLQAPKLIENRGLAVDLTGHKVLFYDQNKLIKILPLAYQSPEEKWFQAPSGYFRAGVKKQKHLSSLFPVVMPYSIQYYEDFFIHGIPYYRNGNEVSSQFTGGCLRLQNDFAKEVYDFLNSGDQILIYKTFEDLEIKAEFSSPVDQEKFFIQRRFLSPYRKSFFFSGTSILNEDYYQHTGVDFRPTTDSPQSIYAIADGKIAEIQLNDGNDHGLGNTIIIEHQLSLKKIYSLYAHLDYIKPELTEGALIKKGETIGEAGNSGFGCRNYWRIGEDGCESQAPPDIHLHFEIKTASVLENPEGRGLYYGYVPDYPQKYGYLNPIEFLFIKKPNYEYNASARRYMKQ